jgi:hypothetical protein
MTDRICPKCQKSGQFGYFETPDHTGVTAMFTHKTGKMKEVKNFTGGTRLIEEEIRCFLTQQDLDKCDWFKQWMDERRKILEEEYKKREEEDRKKYNDMYFKSVDGESGVD